MVYHAFGTPNVTDTVVRVKKVYNLNRTLFTSNGKGQHARIKLKCKRPSISFQYIGNEADHWSVLITPQTIRSTFQALNIKNIDWQLDNEDVILEKLENPYLTIEKAKEFEEKLAAMAQEILSLRTKIVYLENHILQLQSNPAPTRSALQNIDFDIGSDAPDYSHFIADSQFQDPN